MRRRLGRQPGREGLLRGRLRRRFDDGVLAAGTPAREELEQSTGQSCAEALPSELGAVADGSITTAAYGDGAIATRGGDTAFLARFADGWRVTAAGCTHIADDKPYECTVKGA